MAVQRVGARPSAIVQQAAIGSTFDGTQPTSNLPVHDANGKLVFPTEAAGPGGGLFEFEQDRPVAISRVHIEVPSVDVAGWSLFITDGTLDVLVVASTVSLSSYTIAALPILLMRGESLKLVMVGASAGIIKATVVASTIANGAELPSPAVTATSLGLVIGVDVQAWSAWLDLIDQDLSTAGEPVFAGLRVTGGLIVEGGSVLFDAEQIDLRANYIQQNLDCVTVAAVTGGLVVNYLPTGNFDTTTGFGVVTAGNPGGGGNNPSVTTDAGGVFGPGDIVMISGSDNEGENDGIYEVFDHAAGPGGLLQLRSTASGLNARVEDFTLDQLVANAGDLGMTITQITVSVMRAGTDGKWEAAQGAVTPLVFVDLVTKADVNDTWDMQRVMDPGNDTYLARRSHQNEKVLSVEAMVGVLGADPAGTYFLDVRKNSTTAANGTSVLSGQIDLESLVANVWSPVGTTVNSDGSEDLAAGDDLRAWLISSAGTLAGYTDGVNVCVAIGLR